MSYHSNLLPIKHPNTTDKSEEIEGHIKTYFDGLQHLEPDSTLKSFLKGKAAVKLKELIKDLRVYSDDDVNNALRLESLKGRAKNTKKANQSNAQDNNEISAKNTKKAKPSTQDNNNNNNHLSAAAGGNLHQPPQLVQQGSGFVR